MTYANKNSAHISDFVVTSPALDSIIPKLAKCQISRDYLTLVLIQRMHRKNTIQVSKFKRIGFEKMADFDGGE